MSTNNGWDDDDDFEGTETELLKQLRRQLKEQAKTLKALTDENQTLKATTRERSVKEILTEKGVNPKVAALIPADVDTAEAVTQWLEDFGDVFGVQSAPAEDQSGQQTMRIPDGDAAALRTMQAVQSGHQSTGTQEDLLRRLQDPSLSLDELNRLTGNEWNPYK